MPHHFAHSSFRPFVLILLLFCTLETSAQRFIGGVVAGMNLTMVDGTKTFGYHKVGFNGGPFVKMMLDNKQRFSVTMELLYTQKGQTTKTKNVTGWNGYPIFCFADTAFIDPEYPDPDKKLFYKLRTDYLEIPIVFHFEDPKSKIAIGVGVSWGRLVFIQEKEWDPRYDLADKNSGSRHLTTSVNSGRYEKNDWGIMADVKIPIYRGLKFNFRFQYSLSPFGAKRTFYSSGTNNQAQTTRSPFHNELTFRILYNINEKYMENNEYDRNGKRIGPKWIRDLEAMK